MPVTLTAPRDGTPEPVASPAELAETIARFAAGTGPVAIDAERASGYRYTQRAYLVQLRREGVGTALIDPVPLSDLSGLDAAIADAEWVLHAAAQDLPCLAELGLRPRQLFDTELAARLAGFERVGLAALTEQLLGYALEKHHSAADWSTRPLPRAWLDYAALDVELLLDLRQVLSEELERQGKSGWAAQEFAALAASGGTPPRPRPDPWRRTSGIHRVRSQRGLGVVRELWLERDRIARERDLSPGRVLQDSAIVEAALAMPRTPQELTAIKAFTVRLARRYVPAWIKAVNRVRDMAPADLPQPSPPGDGPPPTNRWADRDPAAARRLDAVRSVVAEIAERVVMPTENLLQPDAVRRLAWSPPRSISVDSVAEHLRAHQARNWQIELTAAALAEALRSAAR